MLCQVVCIKGRKGGRLTAFPAPRGRLCPASQEEIPGFFLVKPSAWASAMRRTSSSARALDGRRRKASSWSRRSRIISPVSSASGAGSWIKHGPSPVRIHSGQTSFVRKRITSQSAGIFPRLVASEMDDWRTPKKSASSACVRFPVTSRIRRICPSKVRLSIIHLACSAPEAYITLKHKRYPRLMILIV